MGVQWVVKLSKLCNLRCRYCYEWPWLGNPRRMDLAELDAFFRHIADFYAQSPQKMDFVWHGGEPLLHEVGYYEHIFASQRRHLDRALIPFKNSIQTNLFLLKPDTIKFLRENFENIGVSVDLFGDQRLDVAGKQSQEKVLENMQRLIDEGVRFGCITVLSSVTAPRVDEIFTFFHELGISFRLLPIYRTGYAHQQDQLGLGDTQIVEALKRVTDLWLDMDGVLQVRPIQDYVANVIRKYAMPQLGVSFYSKRKAELLFIVDTDGGLYSNADAYTPSLSYGNMFQMPLEKLLHSSAHDRAVEQSENRMSLTCASCHLHGACSGFFMGEATPEQRYVDDHGKLKCGIAFPVQQYIERKLAERGVLDLENKRINRIRLPSFNSLNQESEALEF